MPSLGGSLRKPGRLNTTPFMRASQGGSSAFEMARAAATSASSRTQSPLSLHGVSQRPRPIATRAPACCIADCREIR